MRGIFSISGIVLLTAGLTVILTAYILITLSQMGVVAYVGGGWLLNSLNLVSGYLGSSVFFFVPVLFCYIYFFLRLKESLARHPDDPAQIENIRYYNTGIDIFITLFFAIGVLFTAWGLQNALVSALGGVSRDEAARLGAWGILKRLVDNGILIALWTTIVGGAGGYLMRLFKYFLLGRLLTRLTVNDQEQEKKVFFDNLASIRAHVERIERKMGMTA